jgi:beta-galactosidase
VQLKPYASVWDNLPSEPIRLATPATFESLNQRSGFILYKNKVVAQSGGNLQVTELRDFALVFFDGKFSGSLDRSAGRSSLNLPSSSKPQNNFLGEGPELEILVEAMGRINFGQYLMDRKGITERVLINGMQIMEWDHYQLPFDEEFIKNLKPSKEFNKQGVFHRGSFNLTSLGDTFIDVSKWQKGIVWVNGVNLGRYWNIGPQKRLYCPAPFLKLGENDILIFDHFSLVGASVTGEQTLKPSSSQAGALEL